MKQASAALERLRREERRKTIRCAVIWAIIVGVAWFLSIIISYAKQVTTKPDIPQFATWKAISAVSDVPPCFAHPDKPKRVWWVLTARDGTTLIVGDEGVRKRC